MDIKVFRKIPNPDEVPESAWDFGWRWWLAVFAAMVLIIAGSALLFTGLSLLEAL